MKLASTGIKFTQKCEAESNWTIQFQDKDDFIVVGMLWGDKIDPTHIAVIAKKDFAKMCETYGAAP